MILYFSVSIFAMLCVAVANFLGQPAVFDGSFLVALGMVFVIVLYTFGLDLIISLVVVLLPKRFFHPFSKAYQTYAFEKKWYQSLKIKLWKDKIPIGKGPLLVGFAKNKVEQTNNNEYVLRFLTDSCRAEVMHWISAFMPFLFVAFRYPNFYFSIGIYIAFVNFVLQIMPVMVQRYNRPKLKALYERNKKLLHEQ